MEDSKVEEHKESFVPSACSGANACRELALDYSHEFTTHEEFATRDNLVTWVREVGMRLGMIMSVKSSNPGKNRRRRPYVVLVCERAGVYRGKKVPGQDDQGKGKRQTASKKCECPFELKGQKMGMDDEEVGWVLTVECGSHNHSDFENFQGHSYAGRLTSEEMALVEDLSNALVKPKAILSSLKLKNPTNASLIKTVYNARQKIQFKENAGRTQMQLLMLKLSENNYFEYHIYLEETGEVMDLLWTHPTCIKLACSYPYVLVMDCTYKTNIYGLPFLEIVGITSTNKTFSVAFAYLRAEKIDNYVWALKSLAKVMESCHRPNCIVTDREVWTM
ncbi:PREDICTED: protein FAR1-RELATED SEQUENCE 5-like [Erythranthe guttata]|uniref:protein FAR1-RELATED SEQUENCE 5-like n=1 Tax=Erythranthe guttata TaxID=4155 RepID=UPI00064DE6E1|nr:PREDICTED: protein FAR1-RELATED SEQUENCE 5-like [Erythranthe guttata]|eukprot:XP_012844895.1 PREDICTED: protein FAR1-RELATED SEQUENCE 5-like [Erythranthe guttata]